MSLGRFVVARLVATVGIALAVSVVLFAAVEFLPGDAATRILGQNATPDRVEALRAQLNLADGPIERYVSWLGDALQGDFGTSITSQQPVWQAIETPVRNSLILGAVAFVAMSLIAIGLGVAAGRRPGGRADRVVSAITSSIASVPDFVLGGVLIAVFASWLDLLPAVSLVPIGGTPLDEPRVLVLPAATLAIFGGAFGARLIRAVVADAASSPHVEAAVLAGLPERRVVTRHLLPSIIAPTAQVLASIVPYVVGGAIVVEQLFGYPGVGASLVANLAARDVTVVEAIGMILTLIVLAALFTADVVGAAADPRRRTASGATADETSAVVLVTVEAR
ncbi:MAG: ABC transporter permease [Actinomycetota bacterium]